MWTKWKAVIRYVKLCNRILYISMPNLVSWSVPHFGSWFYILRALGPLTEVSPLSFWEKVFWRDTIQTSLKCATARPSVIDSEGPSSIIKSPNIRCFVAKPFLSQFTRCFRGRNPIFSIDTKSENSTPKVRVNRDKTAYVWALDYRWRSFAIDDRRSRGRAL